MREAAFSLLLWLCLSGCTLDAFLFNPRKHEGRYDLPTDVVPADRYDPEGAIVRAADGTRIHLMHIRASGAAPLRAATTVLYCHGNGGNIGLHWERVERLYEMGYQVLIFDYRGYGRSEGKPSEAGLYQDADAAYAFLRARSEVDARRIFLYGHSLGAAVCTDLASRNPGQLAGLILEAPFRSVSDLIMDSAGVSVPPDFLTSHRFDNHQKIDRIAMPLFIMHGLKDDYLMPRYGQDLFDRAKEPKTLWLVPGADHGSIPGEGGPRRAEYMQRVTGFIDSAPR